MMRYFEHWWDHTWNPVGGCSRASPGCEFCYAAFHAWFKRWDKPGYSGIHDGVADKHGEWYRFNGKLTALPDGHPMWTWPLRWPGAKHPKLGAGKPSLIFVGDMSDVLKRSSNALLQPSPRPPTSGCCLPSVLGGCENIS
jgi:protein gp37